MTELPPRPPDSTLVHVIVDTPKGSRNKYKFDEHLGCFRLSRILPIGAAFPWNFGFIPGTRADDGDALDVLVIGEEPMPVGMLVDVKLIGVFAATQTQDGKTLQNDRLVGAPCTDVNPARLTSLSELDARLLDEVEHFFRSYNLAQGRTFTPLDRLGPADAEARVRDAIERVRTGR